MESREDWQEESWTESLFGPFARRQTYLNIAYLFLSFPLGVFYFVLMIIGLAVGAALSFIGIGLFILVGVLLLSRALGAWERGLANLLLDAGIPSAAGPKTSWRQPVVALRSLLGDSLTWQGIVFLLLKLPFGIVSFVVTLVFSVVSVVLIFAPVAVLISWPSATPEVVLLCLIIGLGLALAAAHVFAGLAALWRGLARALLGPKEAESVSMPVGATHPVSIP